MCFNAIFRTVTIGLFVGCVTLSYPVSAQIFNQSSIKIATDRKIRSEGVLKLESVPINPWLPVIETEFDVRLRTKEATAYRALSLIIVSSKAAGSKQSEIDALIKTYGVEPHLTPDERKFVINKSPSAKDKAKFIWRIEAAWVLLWSLGLVEKLDKPIKTCDVPHALKTMKSRSQKQFVTDTLHRPLVQIVDEADKIYRYHWAVVDARINSLNSPAGLSADVIMERHWALNWLIGYQNQDWDDVTTDT